MLKTTARRMLILIPQLILISLLVFMITEFAPDDVITCGHLIQEGSISYVENYCS